MPAHTRTRCTTGLKAAVAAVAAAAAAALAAPTADAAVTCPNPVPVVDENHCRGAGTSAWRLQNPSDTVAGFATATSYDRGQSVELKIARSDALPYTGKVDIRVYRAGWYGGLGARLIPAAGASGVPVPNTQQCNPRDDTTGLYSCSNWLVTYTISGSSLPASGAYIVKIRSTDTLAENHIYFTVRDDDREPRAKVLHILPVSSWVAYNNWGGKSLYFDKHGGPSTVSGTGRAVKVSFDRPFDNLGGLNRFVGPDMQTVMWLERNGYDVSYTDDVQASVDGASLRSHEALLFSGHSEYWTRSMFLNVRAARDAGVSLMSLSANTAYWMVRYEDGNRSMVCFKTVQGDGSGGSGAVTPNDWGPDGRSGTADDALGADGLAGTADDNPQNSTTTFRDNGAPPGDPNAPPGGRVGPDLPENQLFGVMYVGDNDSRSFPLTVPAGNASGEFAADRMWRNAGLSVNASTDIGTDIVGWEWDAVPTQPQYLSRQPAGVKRLSDTDVQVATDNSWLQDEGRHRLSIPPAGQPGTVQAVKYTAPSGALVFASGTIQWAFGLGPSENLRIEQATYNVLSDMGVSPATPMTGLVLDPAGANRAPVARFTFTPDPPKLGETVRFDAGSSSDPDGTIARFEWDLDGNGTFETDTGAGRSVSRSYETEGARDVRLRVTDDLGATDVTVRTVDVKGPQPPAASFTVAPNPAVTGQAVTFDGSASTDPDGRVVGFRWDLDGDGTFETDTGATPTTSRAYERSGTVDVGLRVTDDAGKTGTATLPLTVNSGGVSNYGDAVLDTEGLMHYWRLGESEGTAFADSRGTATGALQGGPTVGAPGGPPGDPNTAVAFDGLDDAGRVPVDLSGVSQLTVEFWLRWDVYADDDRLAMELTDNFNVNGGGFLVDPNAPQFGGTFGVAIGDGGSRNNVFFARPSAGRWHHYAFVMDSTAPAAEQIVPYVDGRPVAFSKRDSSTGAGSFAQATLWMMSRAGSALNGRGALDEVALYARALPAGVIAEHAASFGTNRRPSAAFTASPNPVKTGVTVTFDGSASSDPDGTVKRFEWDLDGDGAFEADTGTIPTITRSYATEADVTVGLRVTDDLQGADTETVLLKVGDQPPIARVAATPDPAITDLATRFDASGSADVDGTITRFEWDLDGDGAFETDTGTTATASRTYATVGTRDVRVRVTDDGGRSSTTRLPLAVGAAGVSRALDTHLNVPGLRAYWRFGEASGSTLASSAPGGPEATATGVQLGVPGAVAGDADTAARFAGEPAAASAPMQLSDTKKLSVAFWLRWDRYADDNSLALELTDNLNANDGGFVVDPNAPQGGGTFGVGLGRFDSRNNIFFDRPSAGRWHHYVFVMDTTAAGESQLTPYVDGRPVRYTKLDSGTNAGTFADARLWMMSRAGSSLFGRGDLDELALFDRALDAATVAELFAARGTNRRPEATFTISRNPQKPGEPVTFDATGSGDPDGTIVRHQWDLDGDGSFETDSGTTSTVTRSYDSSGTRDVRLRVLDDRYGTDTVTRALTIGNASPVAAFSWSPTSVHVGSPVTFDGSASSDADGTVTRFEWDLDGNGSFERDTGSDPRATHTPTTAGTVSVGLRATDDDGATATTRHSVRVRSAPYPDGVLATAGLLSYWRMEETDGTTLADARSVAPATTTGRPALGVPGALGGDDRAVRFDGVDDAASARVNLNGRSAATVEFWARWAAFADDDALAMELTPNFNLHDGGFLVNPNAATGGFAAAVGRDANRTAISFARPSANEWHHVAIVMDLAQPPGSQITPYVDGVPVPFTLLASGSGATSFADADLHFMSRGSSALFGAGDLDELAVYDRALSAATIADHHANGAP